VAVGSSVDVTCISVMVGGGVSVFVSVAVGSLVAVSLTRVAVPPGVGVSLGVCEEKTAGTAIPAPVLRSNTMTMMAICSFFMLYLL